MTEEQVKTNLEKKGQHKLSFLNKQKNGRTERSKAFRNKKNPIDKTGSYVLYNPIWHEFTEFNNFGDAETDLMIKISEIQNVAEPGIKDLIKEFKIFKTCGKVVETENEKEGRRGSKLRNRITNLLLNNEVREFKIVRVL